MARLMQSGETADVAIELDEADARVLIDAKLASAGWSVDSARLRLNRDWQVAVKPNGVRMLAVYARF